MNTKKISNKTILLAAILIIVIICCIISSLGISYAGYRYNYLAENTTSNGDLEIAFTVSDETSNEILAIDTLDLEKEYTVTVRNTGTVASTLEVSAELSGYSANTDKTQLSPYVEYIKIKSSTGNTGFLHKNPNLLSWTLEPGESKSFTFEFDSATFETILNNIETKLEAAETDEEMEKYLNMLRCLQHMEVFPFQLHLTAESL